MMSIYFIFFLQSFECNVDDLENDGDYAELGRGQYGSVYRMRHKPTNTIMAVKVRYLVHRLGFSSFNQ